MLLRIKAIYAGGLIVKHLTWIVIQKGSGIREDRRISQADFLEKTQKVTLL